MPGSAENPNSNIPFLKPDQIESMRDAAHEGMFGLRDEAIITILYDTGLRRSEHAGVDREMLDLDDEQLRIPGHIQKDYPNEGSSGPQGINLDPEGDLRTVRTLKSYLSTHKADSPALVPSRKADRMTGKGINDVVKRTVQRAEVRPYTHTGRAVVDDVTAHILRHSIAYRFLHVCDGYTLYDVRNRLRHERIATTERKYDHFDSV